MSVMFKPAIKIMNNLTFKSKLFLISFITTFIVCVLSFQLTVQSLSIMNFSRKELVGVNYVDKLNRIMEDIQKYRNLETSYLLGDYSLKDKLIELREKIDQTIDEVLQYETRTDNKLKTREDLLLIKSAWELIKGDIIIDPTKSNFVTISNLLANLQNLINKVCDNSNLTLDPDINTFYLMDSICTKIPHFTEQISLVRDIGTQALISKTLNLEDREKLIVAKTLANNFSKVAIKNNFDKVSEVLEKKTSTPSEFNSYIEVIYSQTSNLANLLNTTLLNNNFNIKPELFSEKFFTLLDITYKLDRSASKMLYRLIDERVQITKNNLYLNITLAILGLILLIYLFIGMYLSIINSMLKLIQGSEKLAKGDFDAKVHLTTKDEFVNVANSFNAMCSAIVSIDNEISQVLENILKGSFKEKIKQEYYGSFANLKTSLNKIVGDARTSTTFYKKNLLSVEKEIQVLHDDYQLIANQARDQIIKIATIFDETKQMQMNTKQNIEYNKRTHYLIKTISSSANQEKLLFEQIHERLANLEEFLNKLFYHVQNVLDKVNHQTHIFSLQLVKEADNFNPKDHAHRVDLSAQLRQLSEYTNEASNEIKGLMMPILRKCTLTNKRISETYVTNETIIKTINHLSNMMTKTNFSLISLSNKLEGNAQVMIQMKENLSNQYELILVIDSLLKKMSEELTEIDRPITVI